MPKFLPHKLNKRKNSPPGHVRDVLGPDHLCFLAHELVESWDLAEFEAAYSESGGAESV